MNPEKELIFISGGQRSGKSRFGQQLAEARSEHPVYLATARIWDEDFRKRIDRHRADRGHQWTTLEEDSAPGSLDLRGKTVLLDCITLWLTNLFHDLGYNREAALDRAKNEWQKLSQQRCRLIVISNEIGMGVHAERASSRHFADLQGWMNQEIAASADEAYLMVSGLAMKLK